MDYFLELPRERQRLVYEQAHARLDLPPVSLEKDFWVCLTLRELFGLPRWRGHLAFKGGTSLAKGWRLIERFSEDREVKIRVGGALRHGTLGRCRKSSPISPMCFLK